MIAAVFVFVGPYLTPGLEPSRDARLNRTYERFERAQGVDGIPAARRGGQRRHEPGERLRLRDGPVLADRALGHPAGRPLHEPRGGRRPRARARAPLERPHPGGDRLVRALRAARRARPDARDAAPRRHGRAGRRPARAVRRRRLPAGRRPGTEPRQPRHGERGGLEGALARRATPPRPVGCSASSPRPRSATPALRRGPTSCSRPTRPSPSGSRWRTPGQRASEAGDVSD